MNLTKINLKKYKNYEKLINIKLFNNIVSFIIETTNIDCGNFIKRMQQKNIWFERAINKNIQEDYGFKYFGELLERFEERVGTDIKDIRAIALSLAYSKELITKEMTVGNQLINFITKINGMSENDIYLKAALYMYDENKYNNLFQQLINQEFQNTEDVIFVLSLFDDIEQGLNVLENQLIELVGKSKTISAMENYGIYNWLIQTLYPIIKNKRNKQIELLKALITIPTGLIKKNDKSYNVLINNGYSKEEISFLNYICILYSTIPKTVKVGKSIVEEKIAINFCINILNSETNYPDEVYEFICDMMSYYKRFDIKCYGYKGIKEAIIDSIDIKVPKAFIKLYRILDRKLYSFDILDTKWDIVQQELSKEEYMYLFDIFLLMGEFDKQQLETRINKYNKLTNLSYIDSFNLFDYSRTDIYTELVEKEVISLNEQFENYITNSSAKNNIHIQYLRKYVNNIETKKAFEFIKYFLNCGKYTIKDIKKYELGFDTFISELRYSYHLEYHINLKRECLSAEENKLLLTWVDNYVFYTSTENYINFVIAILKNDFISTIVPKEDLRALYFTVIEIDKNIKGNTYLRQKYLSEKELNILKQKEKEEKEKQELLEKQKRKNKIIEKFNEVDKLSFKNIYAFCYDYTWYKEDCQIACNLAKEYLLNDIENHKFTYNEITYFNEICNLLIQEELITLEELKEYILKYVWKGESIICKQY